MMALHRFLIGFCLALFICLPVIAQQAMEEVIYLKNGGIVRGTIIEQVPGKTVKIRTRDGNVFVHNLNDVERITKESPVASQPQGSSASMGKFSVRGSVGTDVSGGLGFGGGIAYIWVPAPDVSKYEFGVDYFFHEYDWKGSDTNEYTDLSVIGIRANWLWNYQPGESSVYFITGVGVVFAFLDFAIEYNPAVYGYSLTETYDYSSVGNLINLGAGWTSASGIGLRLETPVLFFYGAGNAAAVVPTFTLGVVVQF